MRLLLFFFAALTAAAAARAQTPPAQTPSAPAAAALAPAPPQAGQTVCGQPVPAPTDAATGRFRPRRLPDRALLREAGRLSDGRGQHLPLLHPDEVAHQQRPRPGGGCRTTNRVEQIIREDFKRLWATNFLDDLAIRVEDYRFANGVIGKIVVYNMEERQRVKIVDYEGLKKVDQSKIEEKLKEKSITIRLDSFIDPGLHRAASPASSASSTRTRAISSPRSSRRSRTSRAGPKLVHVTFHVTEGPKVKIRRRRLRRQQGDRRRHARAEDEGEQGEGLLRLHHRRRHLQGRQVRGRRAARHRLLPRRGLHHGPGRSAAAEDPRGFEGRQDALGTAADSGHRRQALRGRRVQVRGQQGRQRRGAAAAVQVSKAAKSTARRRSRRGSRRRRKLYGVGRLLRVHGLSRSAAARRAEDGAPDGANGPPAPTGPPAPAAADAPRRRSTPRTARRSST